MSVPKDIVIIGGGIIGCTTAYYLTRHPAFLSANTRLTVLEASKIGVAQGASGKAGGLVARWAYPKELVNISFPEHVRLAEEHEGAKQWGWRMIQVGRWEGRQDKVDLNTDGPFTKGNGNQDTVSLEKTNGLGDDANADDLQARSNAGLPADLNWVKPSLTEEYSPMAPDGHTAQVHPYLFTTSMLALAQERGAQVILGRATSIEREDGRVTGVTYHDHASGESCTLPADRVVLAAGAWSPSLAPSLPIGGTRAHSITIDTGSYIAPYCLFTELYPSGATPEIYARADEVYACGPGDHAPLPETVDDVEVDAKACADLHGWVAGVSEQLRKGEVKARQACYLPVVTRNGGPIVGEAVKIAKGLIIATGHTCWGICNAPGTAKALSELMLDGKIQCANLSALDPAKYSC